MIEDVFDDYGPVLNSRDGAPVATVGELRAVLAQFHDEDRIACVIGPRVFTPAAAIAPPMMMLPIEDRITLFLIDREHEPKPGTDRFGFMQESLFTSVLGAAQKADPS